MRLASFTSNFMAVSTALALALPVAVGQEMEAEYPGGGFNPYGHTPIRVFVDTANLTGDTRRYHDEVRAAWAFWEAGGNGALEWEPSFEEVTKREAADILVWFVDAGSVPCGGEPGSGCGSWGVEGIPGEVSLAMRLPWNQQLVPFDDLQETGKHEFGHALGLDHSTDPDDVMYHEGSYTQGALAPGWQARLKWALALVAVAAGGSGLLWVSDRVRSWRAARRFRELEEASRTRPK